MQFISASLGVDCDFCNVDRKPEADDKKKKLAAREMIELQRTIDRINIQSPVDFGVKLPTYEPLQTADIIPSSAFIKPGETPPPRETATLITPR